VLKKIYILFVFLPLFFVLNSSSCSDDSNPVETNCGEKKNDLINSSGATGMHQLSVTPGQDPVATATWRIEHGSVCTYEHVSFSIEVEINAAYADTFAVESFVLLNPLYIPQIQLSKSVNYETGNAFYRGNQDVGLKQVFGEGPGEFTFFLELSFPSTGDTNQDTEFINQAVKKVYILCSFYYAK